MNALKNLSLILLLSLAFTGCHNKSSKINDFNLLLYAVPSHAGHQFRDIHRHNTQVRKKQK